MSNFITIFTMAITLVAVIATIIIYIDNKKQNITAV
jgi:hypothetical protein